MIIDYISDLHEDYCYDNVEVNEESVKKFFTPLCPKGEILIVAGDTSENNVRLFRTLYFLKEQFNYKKIFFVLGNHELYARGSYPSYREKIKDLKKIFKLDPDLILLDGDVVEYKGIRIGGTMMWYDGCYSKFFNLDKNFNLNDEWIMSMPDANGITGLDHYKDLFFEENKKLKKIYKKVDILVTHIPPICNPKYVVKFFRDSLLSSFFYFNGSKYIENTTAKHWIIGHIHSPLELKFKNLELHCNPKGYGNSATRKRMKQIII